MDALKRGFDYVKARDLAMSNFGCHLSHLGTEPQPWNCLLQVGLGPHLEKIFLIID